tara:strand:- start:206 stop:871 length:666 start_codon:yes stop_codon:yes gene_type:complete
MATLGAAQTDFEKIFGGGRVFHDPRLFPRFDCLADLLTMSTDNSTKTSGSDDFQSITANHGANLLCAATADSYNTIVDISGGAGVCSYAYGPKLTGANGTITFRFTVDGTVNTVATHSSGTNSVGVLGGSARGTGTYWETLPTTAHLLSLVGSNESVIRVQNQYAYINLAPPSLAMSGAGGVLPVLGWTDSFKVEVKSSTGISTVSGSGNAAHAGVGYHLL